MKMYGDEKPQGFHGMNLFAEIFGQCKTSQSLDLHHLRE